MANPGTPKNRARLESEIERNREEGNWNKCIELAQQLPADNTQLTHFLMGEAKLEKYLEAPKETAQSALLLESQHHLKTCLNGTSSPLAMDANLLLAKSYYVSAEHTQALKHIEMSGIDNISTVEKALPLRVMKLVAESFAVKGMSLETQKPNDTDVRLACLTKATDLGIRYMQNVEKLQGPYTVATLGSILEVAIQRAPFVYINDGQIRKASEQYRHALNACETPSTMMTRQILSRQLAEVILRGISRSKWTQFDSNVSPSVKPLKPQQYFGQSLFTPREREEEIILLLMISEMLASRNVVLDRSPEFNDTRIQTLNNVMAVYDLLTITLTPFRCFVTDIFERAMKFSFEVKHIWLQFALTLMESKRHAPRALLLLKEVSRMDADDPLPCLLGAKLCITELNEYNEALELAKESKKRCNDELLMNKINLMIGIAHALLYETETETVKKRMIHHLNESVLHLQSASSDSSDHLPYFHLALHMAHQRALTEAVNYARISLALNSAHLPTIQLLILCLSSLKQYQEALNLCEAALEEYPEHMMLLYTKAHLEEVAFENGHSVALLTAKELLNCWRMGNNDEKQRNCASNANTQFYCLNYDSLSIKLEQTLSEVVSLDSGAVQNDSMSMNCRTSNGINKPIWNLHIHIWLLIVELFIKLGQIPEAESCVSEGVNCIFGPLSHQLMYIKGILCKSKGQLIEAKMHLQNTISINPKHAKALQQLGHTYYLLGNQIAADKYLKDSLNVNATMHETWSYMGMVLEVIKDHERAVNCQLTSLQLEATAPVLPFNMIPRAVLE